MAMMMMPPYPQEAQGLQNLQSLQGLPGQDPTGVVIETLPMWQEAEELSDHREYIFHYHTMMCPQFAHGYCPRHKGSRWAPPQCFCYHFESQRRRPLVDTFTGQLRYWDVLCERVAEGEECPCGDLCPFAHTREEISYHAAKYKTKFCNDRDCRGQEVCCFAHSDAELRVHALERYSYWSVFGGGPSGPQGVRAVNPGADLALVANRNNATGALYHPKVYKHRFCASYPDVAVCRRGDACAFAHSREEIRTPLLASDEEEQRPSALTNEFFMYRFKTLWCPVGVQHDWQTCVYAHNYQDARRHPGIGYGPRPCPYWKRKETALEYAERCPLGVRCPFSHGAKEQLYHPTYFKTVTCQDWPHSNCPRGKLCAFWHKRSQQRSRPSSQDEFNYKLPIPETRLEEELQPDFLSPPFKLLNSLQADPSQCDQQALTNGEGQLDDLCGPCGPLTCSPCGPGGMSDVQCQPPLSAWAPTFCSFGGPGTPTTPTTAADCDEAASADSSSGSGEKAPLGATQDEEGGPGGVPSLGQVPQPCDGSQMDMPWQQGGMMGMTCPAYGSNCQMAPPMMCYVQMQPNGAMPQQMQGQGGQEMGGQAMPKFDAGAENPGMPLPLQQEPNFGQPGCIEDGMGGQGHIAMWGNPCFGGPGCGPMGPMGPCGPNFGGGDWMYNCGGGPMPPFMGNRIMMEPDFSQQYNPAFHGGEPCGEATPCIVDGASPSPELPKEEEPSMPTCNGFIHFKETNEEEDDEAPVRGRPRAMSH